MEEGEEERGGGDTGAWWKIDPAPPLHPEPPS